MKRYYGKSKEQLRDLGMGEKTSRNLFQQISIYGIFRTMFLKRIESSVEAFDQSLKTYERKLKIFEQGVVAGKIISTKNFEALEAQLMFGDEDGPSELENLELEEEQVLDDNVTDQKYEVDILLKDIKKEKYLINLLSEKVAVLKNDNAKLKSFINLIEKIDRKTLKKKF